MGARGFISTWETDRSGKPVRLLLWAVLVTSLDWSNPAPEQPESSTGTAVGQSRRNDPSGKSSKSAAEKLYRLNCARCHGKDGKGAEVRERFAEIPNFRDESWQEERSDAEFRASIVDGKGTHMPGFGVQLTDEQIRSLVDYVRGFDSTPRKRGSASASDFEERFRQLQEELRELQKQFRDCKRDSKKKVPCSGSRP
jgi:mono/diheme cytochrome c family protein